MSQIKIIRFPNITVLEQNVNSFLMNLDNDDVYLSDITYINGEYVIVVTMRS